MLTAPPRIEHVVLRSGTRYRTVEEHRMSEPRTLERDAEVQVRLLALGPGDAGAYVLEGEVILVAYEDDVRGPRTA